MTKPVLDGEVLFPSAYICADDLKGKDWTLTIESVSKQELHVKPNKKNRTGKIEKLVLTFQRARKKFVCNVTNAEIIVDLWGKEARQWIGKQITLFPTRVPFGRGMVDACRIRGKRPSGAGSDAAELDQTTSLDDLKKLLAAALDDAKCDELMTQFCSTSPEQDDLEAAQDMVNERKARLAGITF